MNAIIIIVVVTITVAIIIITTITIIIITIIKTSNHLHYHRYRQRRRSSHSPPSSWSSSLSVETHSIVSDGHSAALLISASTNAASWPPVPRYSVAIDIRVRARSMPSCVRNEPLFEQSLRCRRSVVPTISAS
jgi:hypothetical protein